MEPSGGAGETGGADEGGLLAGLFTAALLLESPRCPPEGFCDLVVAARDVLESLVRFADAYPDPDPGATTGAATALVLDEAAARLSSPDTGWFWVPDECAEWLVPAAMELPDDVTCDVGSVPSAGLVFFDSQLLSPGGDGLPCPVRGAVWFAGQLGDAPTPGVHLVWFTDPPSQDSAGGDAKVSRLAPAGWSVWAHGDGLLEGCGRGDPEAHAWDRRVLSVLWHLLANPQLAEPTSVVPPRPRRRAAQRAGVTTPPGGVRLVHLSPTRAGHGAGGGGIRSVRWWVRGHWRSQPYGPRRSLRRPVWIDPHVRGPEGAPLRSPSRTVTAVDTPRR